MTAIHDPIPGPALDQLTDLAPTEADLVDALITRLYAAARIADDEGWAGTAYVLRNLAGDLAYDSELLPGDEHIAGLIATAILAPTPEHTPA